MVQDLYPIDNSQIKWPEVTQSGKKKLPIHPWFKFAPAFSPFLVRDYIKKFNLTRSDTILDPFCGSGTTLLESKFQGINATGYEINPFLQWKTANEIYWNYDLTEYQHIVSKILMQTKQICSEFKTKEVKELCEHLHTETICIRNVNRWWNPNVQKVLITLRHFANQISPLPLKKLFLHNLACILLNVANITYGRLQIAFLKEPRRISDAEVIRLFRHKQVEIINDLKLTHKIASPGSTEVFLRDSTKTESYPEANYSAIITSPPYCNRYSYVWNTRPYLFFFNLIDSTSATSAIDSKTIGGTWGKATYTLTDQEIYPYDEIAAIITPFTNQIYPHSEMMAKYVIKYFNLLFDHFLHVQSGLQNHAQLAYVVGNSAISRVYIPVDEIIFDIMKQLNYDPMKIHRFRVRNSRRGLYEATIFSQFTS